MLQSLFQELDHRDPPSMVCADDTDAYQKKLDRLRVHIFLSGLDPEFDQVRSEILRKEPKMDLDQSFAYVRRDAQQRANFIGATASLDATVMMAQRFHGPHSSHRIASTQGVKDKPVFKCTHCGGSKHTREHCYELVGFPSWWDHSKNKRSGHKALQASATPETPPISGNKSTEHASASVSLAASGITGYALNVSSTSPTSDVWIIDSGASDHMTCDSNKISSLSPSSQSVVSNANGSSSPVVGEGSLSLTDSLHLESVLVVPSLDFNLLSVAQITHALYCTVMFWPNCCIFQDILTRTIIGYGTRRGKLYYLDLTPSGETSISQAFKTSGAASGKNQNFIWLWHKRLGHASFGYLKKLFPSWFSKLSDFNFKCDVCELAKSHRVSFPLSMNKSTVPFAIIHSDIWGPALISTPSGARWFVIFIDDCTRMTWISLLKTKGEVCTTFQQFYKMVETQFHEKIKILRSDNGGEFVNHNLCQFLEAHGIEHQRTCPYTPQQNGVAERKNRQLLEVVRASLFDAQMPRSFWGEAVCSAAYIINRVPSSVLNFQTPLQAFRQVCALHSTPNLEPRVFGCVTFVHLYTHQRNKLEPRALKCVFIGYAQHQKGYRCYHPPTQKL